MSEADVADLQRYADSRVALEEREIEHAVADRILEALLREVVRA